MTLTLLTGATGFLGQQIARQYPEPHNNLRCSGRSSSAELPDYHSANLCDPRQLPPLLENVDTVIHAAGLAHQFGKQQAAEDAFFQHNVGATENVLNASAQTGVRHVVLVSSVSVYGPNGETTRDTYEPEGPYGHSKLEAERVASQIAQQSDLQLTILRMATIYGEGDPGNVRRLLRTLDRGRFVWIGTGQNRKSLIHVEDAARACVLAAASPRESSDDLIKVYNVSAAPCSMRDVVQTLEAALGVKPARMWLPASVPLCCTWAAAKLTRGRGLPGRVNQTIHKWLRDDAYDGTPFMDEYGFRPQVSLQDGISREVAWHRRAA